MKNIEINIPFSYMIVCLISSVVNILSQSITISLYRGSYSVELSMLFGTSAGIPVKYILEKKYVFDFQANDLAHDGRLLIVYSLLGFITVSVFWMVEYFFYLYYSSLAMRYLGAVIGLSISAALKFHLDKKFVFKKELI